MEKIATVVIFQKGVTGFLKKKSLFKDEVTPFWKLMTAFIHTSSLNRKVIVYGYTTFLYRRIPKINNTNICWNNVVKQKKQQQQYVSEKKWRKRKVLSKQNKREKKESYESEKERES